MNLTEKQANEIYKGLKQGEFLKDKLAKTETALDNCLKLREDYKIQVQKQNELIKSKDKLLNSETEVFNSEKLVLESNIKRLEDDLRISEKQGKKLAKKKFWNGFAVGGVSVAVIGTATAFYLITNK